MTKTIAAYAPLAMEVHHSGYLEVELPWAARDSALLYISSPFDSNTSLKSG
ncbi:MAG TPA: hypothetical protein VFS97_08375 [Nitrososphaeraceae archaeon]|nr:hypothetical protein [Nitrososphaeraceae archaeon]